jgi:hypothetical protein
MSIIDRAKRNVSVSEFENNVEPYELSRITISCPYDEQYIFMIAV